MSLDTAIANLVARLETVTSRLEKVEAQLAAGGGASVQASGAGGDASAGADSVSVRDYDNLINQYIRPFVEVSAKIDASVKAQAELVLEAVEEQKKFLIAAAAAKKPDDATLQKLFAPTLAVVNKISALKDNRSKFFNNLAAVSEGVPVLSWVLVTPTPVPHVNEIRGGSEFYSNRILNEAKGGVNPTQVDWVKHFNTFLKELATYVKAHHTTGVSWNPKGGDALAAASAATSSAPAPPRGPPPPPAAAPPAATGGAPKADISAVFGQLNKGTDVTSGLKKVTADMKTKNRTDKTAVVPASAAAPKSEKAGASSSAPAKVKPARLALEGNKWSVENFSDRRDLVIEDTETRQVIYVYGLTNSTLVVKGKVNSVAIDNCKRSAIVVENVISGVEIVNGTSVEVQITGKVPSVAVDKTSGLQLYLSKDGLETEIVTSKSSEMNVLIPLPGQEDLAELPIPEQYKTLIKGHKLVTETVQHSG